MMLQQISPKEESEENQTDLKRRFYGSWHISLRYREMGSKQRLYEMQICEKTEADLHKHLVGCKKNPGHKQFVPVNDLVITKLPKGFQKNEIVELIKAMAALTVRVDVKMTSANRPKFWPHTDVPYAFCNLRGSDVLRLGSGRVSSVNRKRSKKESCPCKSCQSLVTPNKVWWYITVYTARHVVYDELEAKHATCRAFYDSQESPLVTLDGWTVEDGNVEDDVCKLKCVTCDPKIKECLNNACKHWKNLWRDVTKKYISNRDEDRFNFIVSHPHGCPKQVSLGQWIDRCVVRNGNGRLKHTKYTYKTSTCPGSSGARVHALGYYEGKVFHADHVHSGVNCEGTNFSGTGGEYT